MGILRTNSSPTIFAEKAIDPVLGIDVDDGKDCQLYNLNAIPSPPPIPIPNRGAKPMSEHTYKMIELVGSSHTSIESAVQNAIAKAEINESKMRWFEVLETRGHIEDGKIAHWQVRVKIGATLD
jgi:flavin-binding protein dodecin